MRASFTQQTNEVLAKIAQAGYEGYVVGGAVRDFLMQRQISDVDIATSAPSSVVQKLFSKSVDVAIKHGTVLVVHGGQSFEVTSFRGRTLVADLSKRDFTINAIACDQAGVIIDPFAGHIDIKNRLLRGVGSAVDRFKEDPLRLLRGMRFASELAFTIEEKTVTAMVSCANLINDVAMERIAQEFEKICLGSEVRIAFRYFQQSGLLSNINGLVPLADVLRDENTATRLEHLTSMTEIWALLLFSSKSHNTTDFLQTWKQPKKRINEVEKLISFLPYLLERGFSNEALYQLGLASSFAVERVRAALSDEPARLTKVEESYKKLVITEKRQLMFKGHDALQLLSDQEKKQRVGQLLKVVEAAVVSGKVANKKEEIIKWLCKEGMIHA